MENNLREKILETAKALFLEKGYKRTTINNIAKAAGISISTIYLHFSGKKEIFDTLNISENEQLKDIQNAKRASIIQTALILFGEKGYDGVSMDLIARKAGCSKASLYQYFSDKEELYSAVMQETPFYYNFLAIQPEIEGANLEDAIKKIGLAYLRIFDTPERIAFTRSIIRDSKQYPQVSNIYHKNGIGYVYRCVETVLKKSSMKLRKDVDLYLASKTYVGSLFGFAVQYKIVVGIDVKYSDEEVVETLTKIFLGGVLNTDTVQ